MKVQKWGNSLAIRIPGAFAEQLNICEGSEVELLLNGQELTLRPKPQKLRLEDLLAEITPENKHEEIDFGQPEGKELW